ncbi:HET-domain-containing protein, partial [Glonium stellatum]
MAKGSSAAYQKGVTASQQYQDKRTKAAAREDPIAYSCPASGLAEYRYRPLRSDSHIRVLVLEPGCGGELLRCSLEESDLDSQLQFDALSYCWGDASDTRTITCEGCSVSITKSLYDALLRFRKPDLRLRIWADALCINQEDMAERRQQVQLMRRIYQESEKCLVWLGPHTELDGLAFKLLNIIHDFLENHPSDQDRKALIPGKILGKYSTTPGEWDALSHLFARPWFERVWTLQEIVLPRQALI